MKKQYLILTAFALVGILSGCGAKSISEDEAVKVAQKIQAKHNEASFAYPQDKVTASESLSLNNNVISTEYRIIKDQYFYTTATVQAQGDSSNSTAGLTTATYLYTKDSKYYGASDDGTNKTYSELTQAEFTAELNVALNGEGKTSGAYKTIDDTANDAYSTLDNFIEAHTASSSSALSSSVSSSADDVQATYTYSTTGDGNLTLAATGVTKTSDGEENVHENIVFNNYYPESVSVSEKGTAQSGSTSVEGSFTMDFRFHWDSCNPLYPDLSTYTKQSA